jgi:hypothetical protein
MTEERLALSDLLEKAGGGDFLRSAPRPAASLALRAAGVALPPSVQSIASDLLPIQNV